MPKKTNQKKNYKFNVGVIVFALPTLGISILLLLLSASSFNRQERGRFLHLLANNNLKISETPWTSINTYAAKHLLSNGSAASSIHDVKTDQDFWKLFYTNIINGNNLEQIRLLKHIKQSDGEVPRYEIIEEDEGLSGLRLKGTHRIIREHDSTYLAAAYVYDLLNRYDLAHYFYNSYIELLNVLTKPADHGSTYFRIGRRASIARIKLTDLIYRKRYAVSDTSYRSFSYSDALMEMFLHDSNFGKMLILYKKANIPGVGNLSIHRPDVQDEYNYYQFESSHMIEYAKSLSVQKNPIAAYDDCILKIQNGNMIKKSDNILDDFESNCQRFGEINIKNEKDSVYRLAALFLFLREESQSFRNCTRIGRYDAKIILEVMMKYSDYYAKSATFIYDDLLYYMRNGYGCSCDIKSIETTLNKMQNLNADAADHHYTGSKEDTLKEFSCE